MLLDEVTAQTLEQENADGDTEITSNTSNMHYPAGTVTIGDNITVTQCVFEGDVVLNKGSVLQNCVVKGNVTFNDTRFTLRNSTFLSDVSLPEEMLSINTITECLFAKKVNIPSTSSYRNVRSNYFCEKPDGIDDDLAFLDLGNLSGQLSLSCMYNNKYSADSLVKPEGSFYFNTGRTIYIYFPDDPDMDLSGFTELIQDINGEAIDPDKFTQNANGSRSFTSKAGWTLTFYAASANAPASCDFNTYSYPSSVTEFTLNQNAAPAPTLEPGSNGYPKDADGNETDGKTDLDYANWTFKNGVLTLLKGDFDLTGQTTSCDLVIEKDATLTGLYYTGSKITNKGTISGGTYESAKIDIQRGASVVGGTYGAAVRFLNNAPTGGIFLSGLSDSTEIRLKDASNFTFNGLSLPAGSDTIYAIADGTNEQTLKIAYTGSEKIYSWGASFGDTSLGRFYVTGYDTTVTNDQLGATITANNKAISVSLKSLAAVKAMAGKFGTPTLEAVHKPTYRAKDVAVKLGNQEISNNAKLTYSPDLTKITVTDKSGEKTFVKDTDYTATLTDAEGNEVENFDGKPGAYKLAITFKDTADHTESLARDVIQYEFTITKADMTAELFRDYYTVELPGQNGKVAYDGKAHCATVTKNADAPAALNGEVQVTHYEDNPFGSSGSVEPTKPGIYGVEISIPSNDYYNTYNPFVGTFEITKATLPEGTFRYDPATGTLTSNDPAIDADEFTKSNVTYKDAEGNEYTETELEDAPAGEYTVCVTVKDTKGRYEDVTFETEETKTVAKRDLSEDDFDITVEPSISYDGNVHGVSVAPSADAPSFVKADDISVRYFKKGTEEEVEPANAGEYTYVVTAKNDDYYNEKTLTGDFTIKPRTLTAADFEYTAPENLNTDSTPDEIIQAIRSGLKCKVDGLSPYDIAINLQDTLDQIAEKGEHAFEITIRTEGTSDFSNGNFASVHLANNWTYTISDALYPIDSIPNATVTDENYKPLTGPVPAGTKVHVHLDRESLPEDFEFLGWQFTEGSAPVDADDCDLTGEDAWFIMPKGGASLELITPDPEVPGDGGAAVAAVIGTAAVGGAAYLVGTQVWLETNLPKGAAIPTNRQQLADLLWTTAGKPEPKSNVLYTDIAATAADSQKAARWCVEQGLLKDNGETFQPKAYTFRPQVIKAWTDLQAQLKADNK